MDVTGTTWILAADGDQARIFEERQRAGEVRELETLHMGRVGGDYPRAAAHGATVHDRAGHGQHGAGERAPHEEAEDRFLERVAESLADPARREAFQGLVIMAPPRALGVLRQALPKAVQAKLEGSDHHECVRETAEDIRGRLRKVRAKA
ncbi:host attachment protein [Phenylobacterium sp.]|uniref:host attachment protein n=1 Tax=Phenylobacterium sp. TaxID=1871053 RepID=UPI00272F42F7|nr:host attachment protein [Phenylobacterium sp.]MDP1874136.1 host attachment protein [Phenylobacterium sp.]MDP3489604.1 host attachment protein [Phenylobacterium sp.]